MKIDVDRGKVTIEMERELVNEESLNLVLHAVKAIVDIDLMRQERENEIQLEVAKKVKELNPT